MSRGYRLEPLNLHTKACASCSLIQLASASRPPESKRNKFELKPHDRPTWRRPCWRGAARGARATAGGDSGGGSRRAPAAAGRTAIDEGLCGSPQKLIKSTHHCPPSVNRAPALVAMAPGSQSHESVWPSAQRESVWPGAQREFARVAERAARVRVMHRGVRHRLAGAPPRPGRARVRRQGLPALHRDPLLHDCRVPFAPRHPRLDRLVRLHQVVPERLAAARAHVRRWQVRRHRLPRAPARRAPATTSAAPSTAPPAAPAPGSPAPSRAARACSLAAAPSPRSPSTAATCARTSPRRATATSRLAPSTVASATSPATARLPSIL